jgi:proline racemase
VHVPCFADRIDAALEVDGLGMLIVDVAFGGMWFALADASALGFALEPSEARELCEVGERIRLAAREQLPCVHPENPDIAGVSIVQIAESWQGVGAVSKNAVVVAPGGLDRSACGTGLSARIAALHARCSMNLDLRHHRGHARPDRPVPGGLPSHRHLAGPFAEVLGLRLSRGRKRTRRGSAHLVPLRPG